MRQILSVLLCALFIAGIVYGWQQLDIGNEAKPATSISDIEDNPYTIVKIKDKVSLHAPVLSQYPELDRGCEVTSLAMLLQFAGVETNKLTLAKQIKKDPTPRHIQNGNLYFGDPNKGFVGDIYSFNKPGFGVYNKPIFQLGSRYLPGKMINLTGHSFEDLKIYLSDGRPIWVIINTEYRALPPSYFQTWNTKSGKIKVTFKEHSVLITGYDTKYIYFNDPLTGEKNKAPISPFKQAWVQMGSQAITYEN